MVQKMKVLMYLVLVIGGILLLRSWHPIPAGVAHTETVPTPSSATSEETPPSQANWNPPPRPSWEEMLLAIQKNTNSLFGAFAEEQMKELQDFADSIPDNELPDALAELQQLQLQNPTSRGRNLEMRLLRRWADIDPRSATQWATQTPSDIRSDAVAAATAQWAEKDFSAAEAWATQLSDGSGRVAAIESVIGAAVYANPKEALTLAAELPEDPTRDQLIINAAGTWAASAPQDAATWAKQVSDDRLRQQVVSAIAIRWSDTDPVSAADLIANSLPSGDIQDEALIAIVERWGLKDPNAAKQWVQQSVNGDLQQAAMDTIAADVQRSKSPTF